MGAKRISGAALLLVSGLALAVALAVGSASASPRALADQAYSDPVGDSQTAPDITAVALSNDPTTGMITLTVTTAAALQPTSYVYAYLNTDLNPVTGSASGSEYFLGYEQHADGWRWGIMKWDGSGWILTTRTPTMSISTSGNTYRWNFAASDVGVSSGFMFYVSAGAVDASDNVVARDLAPDTGAWGYTLATAPTNTPPPTTPAPSSKTLAVEISAPTTTPRYPVAGKQFTVRFAVQVKKQETATVVHIGTGETSTETLVMWKPLTGGSMACNPSVAGKTIPHAESLKAGIAKLSFLVPKTAKGRQLKVKVTITAEGKTATKLATFRVR
jgi:hypothetical protein